MVALDMTLRTSPFHMSKLFSMQAIRATWSLLNSDERGRVPGLLVLMILGIALETLSISLVVPLLALMTEAQVAVRHPLAVYLNAALGNPTRAEMTILVALAILGTYLAKNVFLAFVVWRQNRFIFDVAVALSMRLLACYLRRPYTFHLQRNSASLIQNVTMEADILAVNVIMPAMLLFTELLVFASLFAMMLFIQPAAAALVFLVTGIGAALFFRLVSRRSVDWGTRRQMHAGLMLQHLQQGLGAVKDVKVLGRETDFLEQYRFHREVIARIGVMQGVVGRLPQLWLELLAIASLVALVVSMTHQGQTLETIIPAIGLFVAAAFRIMPSAGRILGANQLLKFGSPAVARLHREFNPVDDAAPQSSDVALPFCDALVLDKVGFQYPSEPNPSIRNVSLTIPSGSCVGFIGPSGSGKSTLVDIVLGLLVPASGTVKVDGVDIHSRLRQWQNNLGYVPQSIFLTDDTLRRNVAFGLTNARIDEDAVRRAIKAAQLEPFVNSLPLGFDTVIGERGVRLSGGQRQRVGIARALYHDPQVLVLDEATSALDAETESGLMQTVGALQGAKTIIIVAHRVSTVAHCDILFQLDQGGLVSAPASADLDRAVGP